jgi:glucose-6-phosphate 1-epimerase
VYDRPFHLDYVVTLAGHQLSTDLHVKNTASSPQDTLEFQALFHTYIRAPSAQALITPLRGLLYYDKTEITEEGKTTAKEEHRDGVDVHKFTDSVYENAPQSYRITWPDGGLKVRSKELKDIVVWNPQQEAGSKLSDMEDGGWYLFSIPASSIRLRLTTQFHLQEQFRWP